MTAMSQIVIEASSSDYHNLCVASRKWLPHIAAMNTGDKNGGPVTLKAWRNHKNMTQADLADLVDTNANMIGYLENGQRALTVDWMRRLAPHLDTRPSALIDETPDDITAPLPNADELEQMIQLAMNELPLGMTFADYPRAVASNLHAQLARFSKAGGFRHGEDEETAPDTDAPPRKSTTQSARAG